jgi:hypothetical protein
MTKTVCTLCDRAECGVSAASARIDDESGSVFSVHETRESAKKQIEKFSWRSSTYRIEEHEVKS